MLELRRREARRVFRRSSALRASAAMGTIALGGAAVTWLEQPAVAVAAGLFATAALMVTLNEALYAFWYEPPWVQVVFDRPLTLPEGQRDLGYGEVLSLYPEAWAGLRGFSGALSRGAARFDPAAGLAAVDALLARPHLDAELAGALGALRLRLEAARAAGARFCLLRIGAWSAAIETNLGLYWR